MVPRRGPALSLELKPCALWLVFTLLSLTATHSLSNDVPEVPQGMTLSANSSTQQLSISWLGGAASTFDLIILRTDFNETVFYETVTAAQQDGRHHWTWTSAEPLECTSLSVRLRSRDGQKTSGWSDIHIHQGMDLPSRQESMMFPQDPVLHVGNSITVCCIVGERKQFGKIHYNKTVMDVVRISRRSYAASRTNLSASKVSGTNVFCTSPLNTILMGTVLFVGYPPRPTDLECETRDLTSVVCQWTPSITHLYGPRKTLYTLNGRDCAKASQKQSCRLPGWAGNWTLVAQNPLGRSSLSYSAQLTHRVHPVAAANLSATPHARNATLLWDWEHDAYQLLALLCQVEVTSDGHTTALTFSGVGLRSVALLDLVPVAEYRVRVSCRAQQNFWKWGSWSNTLVFRTGTDRPQTPSLWVALEHDHTGRVMWKPMTLRQSHGEITGYELTLWSPGGRVLHRETLLPGAHQAAINLTDRGAAGPVRVSLKAQNAAGMSPAASVVIPLLMSDTEPPTVSRVVGVAGGLPLSWAADANASSGYLVEWRNASCLRRCPVGWTEAGAGSTNVTMATEPFQDGLLYDFSLYGLSPNASVLLQRWKGYPKETGPFTSVPNLMANQVKSDIQLTWGDIPPADRGGFLLGYCVYLNNGSQLTLIANLSDPDSRSYWVRNKLVSSYKFTVKAYNSAGEDAGSTTSITMEAYNWLLLEILASLGTMTLFLFIITCVCYRKRKWVKKAFYPDIPEPKLAGDWSRTQGTLDVKPHANSMVHIVDEPEWDSSKEKLVVIPEEDEDEERAVRDDPVDTDEPMSIRYYNQVVDERPIRPRYPDSSESSASSLDSARTDVTYTGIQTSGSSLTFRAEPPFPHHGQQPHGDFPVALAGGGGGYRPQAQPAGPGGLGPRPAAPRSFPEPRPEEGGSFGAYQPQCSWQPDSPGEADEGSVGAPSMGSPTSVASTQFLLPQEEERSEGEGSSSATTWLHSLLSSTKP